jgi:hypothetical protein
MVDNPEAHALNLTLAILPTPGGTARGREGPPDLGAVSSGGDEQMQEEAGLERRQVPGADQSAGQQVRFRAGKP